MGRRRFAKPRKRVNVYITEELLTRVALEHFDPARGKTDYGALSNLINILLEQYFSRDKGE